MTRRVVLAGMYAPYPGPFEGVEVWGCNFAYKHQKGLTRLYAMDGVDTFTAVDPNFIADVSALGIPVVLAQQHPEIENSQAYPLGSIMRQLFGVPSDSDYRARAYFTSTIAYMLADAIRMGFDEIKIHRILVLPPSAEYISQKACLEFLCGIAMGRGIKLLISADSNICKPAPWETGLYGYEVPTSMDANNSIVSAVQAAMRLKTEFLPAA